MFHNHILGYHFIIKPKDAKYPSVNLVVDLLGDKVCGTIIQNVVKKRTTIYLTTENIFRVQGTSIIYI